MRIYEHAGERWEIELHDERVVTRRFAASALVDDTTSAHASPLRAKWEADRLCSRLAANGYARVSDDTVPLGKRELEDALRASPDDLDTYLVYADWLSEHGDDWGQLIAIQHALQTLPRHIDRTLREETTARQDELSRMETMLRYRLGSRLWGTLGETVWNEATQTYLSDLIDAKWQCGFLRSVRIRDVDPEIFETLITTLHALPIALVLRGIQIEDDQGWPAGKIEALVERAWPLLETLTIYGPGGRSAPLDASRVVPLLANAPKLLHLELEVATTHTDALCKALANRSLETLTIRAGIFSEAGIRALARVRHLRKLELHGSMPADTHARLRELAPSVRVFPDA